MVLIGLINNKNINKKINNIREHKWEMIINAFAINVKTK